MKSWSMIVADAAGARFFSIEWPEDEATESGPKLVELEDLANPDGLFRPREVFADRAGAGSSSRTGQRHAFDDRHDEHKRLSSERFAEEIAEHARERLSLAPGGRLLLVAETRMLGHLRRAIGATLPRTIDVVELGDDLMRHTPTQIREALVHHGILPSPTLPTAAVYRPRGQPT